MLLAEKEIDKTLYKKWHLDYKKASAVIEDREGAMDKVAEEIEKDFELVGATAIEDKLQDEVADTISFMKSAHIKVWVLTGDKVETAINIGYACALLKSDMEEFIIKGTSSKKILEEITKFKKDYEETCMVRDCGVIVDGKTLLKIAKSEDLQREFLELAENAAVVLACRVSPKQKSEIVMMVKNRHKNSTMLAIGDGANDVNMICAAHIGVGISGLEGQQAARAADYSIG